MSQELNKQVTTNDSVDVQPDVQVLIAETKAIQPEKPQAEEIVSKLYPHAKEAFARGVTRKALLAMWADKGFKLHPTKFKELYNAEAKKRGDDVDGGQA